MLHENFGDPDALGLTATEEPRANHSAGVLVNHLNAGARDFLLGPIEAKLQDLRQRERVLGRVKAFHNQQ